MLNIVDKYTVETDVVAEDGVVAIEYVVTAAAVVAGLALIFGAFGDALVEKLNDIIADI